MKNLNFLRPSPTASLLVRYFGSPAKLFLWESLHVLGVHLRVQVSVDGMDHLGKYLPH